MCTATTTLYYGITVKAMDFCLLAAAYDRSRLALLAIDLILARRARGRLEVENSVTTDVRALPAEVWDLVKNELVDEAFNALYEDLEDEWLSGCDCCSDWVVEHISGGRSADIFAIDRARDYLAETEGVPGLAQAYEERVERLLSEFGLCLAARDLFSSQEWAWVDLDSAWAIALPLASEKGSKFPSTIADIEHESSASHALSAISPATFVLPADADTRFRRLLSTFPVLEPVSFATSTIGPPLERAKGLEPEPARKDEQLSAAERRERKRAAAQQARRAASEPRWMLWSRGGSCL